MKHEIEKIEGQIVARVFNERVEAFCPFATWTGLSTVITWAELVAGGGDYQLEIKPLCHVVEAKEEPPSCTCTDPDNHPLPDCPLHGEAATADS